VLRLRLVLRRRLRKAHRLLAQARQALLVPRWLLLKVSLQALVQLRPRAARLQKVLPLVQVQ
jgi:hypothetical protein